MARIRIQSFAALSLLVVLCNHIQADDPYATTVGPAYGYTAQGASAQFQSIAGQPGSTYLPFGGIANPYDDGYVQYNLPFNFNLFSSKFPAGSPLFVSANGYVTFGTLSISPIPSNFLTGAPSFGNQPAFAPLFMDLTARGMQDGGPGLYAQVSGPNGQRRLTLEWSAMQDVNGGQPSNPISFQAVLFEGSNNIQFNYQSTLFGTAADNGKMAAVGIRDVSFADPPDNVLQWGYLAGTADGIGVGLGDSNFQINFFGFSSVPEPTSIALCAMTAVGTLGAVSYRRWRQRKKAL